MTKIEWTDEVWNPLAGCSVLTPGCTNCYAMKMARRLEAIGVDHYAGLTQTTKGGAVWTGKVALAPNHILTKPLRWRKPRRIFVNSMSDLFHETVPDEWIDRVFAVMALAPQHTFQVLTKRSARMLAYLTSRGPVDWSAAIPSPSNMFMSKHEFDCRLLGVAPEIYHQAPLAHPLPNVWLGVSAEDQTRADERIPDLLATPAAVRFVSLEPMIGAVDLNTIPSPAVTPEDEGYWHSALESGDIHYREGHPDVLTGRGIVDAVDGPWLPGLDWVIVGGESGVKARPFHVDWARSIVKQCQAAGVPVHVKQLGAQPRGWCAALAHVAPEDREDVTCDYHEAHEQGQECQGRCAAMVAPAGGDPTEWPEDLRVQQWPALEGPKA